eukprot:CAMPEP_0183524954 /NCGR_PEP_ID=MMETSP0371-20130417/20281_1 /TAXON_ID=268820 /ORGANISM="Peridinium aciculiferum, Strain PAER-2" /LENGTH=218 /DNA_ID=CAMNT_0025724131 /DNA_START=28 /DNA_END=684 /DNA_ORIENTATION=+
MYVTVLSGSLLDSLGNVLERPRNVVLFLGQSMPQVSVYFVSVVLSKGLLTLPLSALRPVSFAIWSWRTLKDPAYEAPLTEESRAASSYYCQELPDVLLVFTICVTFAPLAPLILFAGAVFFGAALLHYRFRALYAWSAPFQGQGQFFSFFLSQALGVMPICVITLLAALALKQGFWQAFALLPLLVFLLAFGNRARSQQRFGEKLPLKLARQLDEEFA